MSYPRQLTKSVKSTQLIFVITPRSQRIAKEKVKTRIRNAIIPEFKTFHASVTSHAALKSTLFLVSRQISESPLGDESSEVDESFNDHETLMKNIQRMIQSSITDAFAVRDERKKQGNFVISMSIASVEEYLVNADTAFSSSFSLISSLAMSQHVFSR